MRAEEFVLTEAVGTRLKDLASIATDMPDADFWLIRKGSNKIIGKPVKEFEPQRIGIKVIRTDVLDPNYLYYAILHLYNQGYFASIATGILNLVHIRVADVANLRIGSQDDVEEGWKEKTIGAGIVGAGLAGMFGPGIMKNTPAVNTVVDQSPPAISQPYSKQQDISTKVQAPIKYEAEQLRSILEKTARNAGIKGKELAQFLAQSKHETMGFTRMTEFGNEDYFIRHYDPTKNPAKAKILGNTHPGDGIKYRGRGYLQITGKENYSRCGDALNLPLEQQPELLEKPEIAAKAAVWYWNVRVRPNVKNFANITQVTKRINPALKGLKKRFQIYKDELATLMNTKPNQEQDKPQDKTKKP
jgi:putative chitinase